MIFVIFVILNFFCEYFIENFRIYVHYGEGSVTFFSVFFRIFLLIIWNYFGVFIWFEFVNAFEGHLLFSFLQNNK